MRTCPLSAVEKRTVLSALTANLPGRVHPAGPIVRSICPKAHAVRLASPKEPSVTKTLEPSSAVAPNLRLPLLPRQGSGRDKVRAEERPV